MVRSQIAAWWWRVPQGGAECWCWQGMHIVQAPALALSSPSWVSMSSFEEWSPQRTTLLSAQDANVFIKHSVNPHVKQR